MSRVLSPLVVSYVGKEDEELWELIYDFVYKSDVAQCTFVVKRGFQFDFASVPRLPLMYMLTGGKAKIASLVHDYLCVTQLVSREMADKVFMEIMELTGVPAWRRKVMWGAVRAYAVLSGKDSEYKTVPKIDVDMDTGYRS